MRKSRFRRVFIPMVAALASCTPVPVHKPTTTRAFVASSNLPAMKSFSTVAAVAPQRTNSEIAQDFLDLTFRMESGRPVPSMTRFEQPISVRVSGQVPGSLVPDLRSLLTRLRNEAGIDIFMTGAPEASITIEALPRAVLQRAVPRAACFVVPRVSSWSEFKAARNTPQVDWTTLSRRDRAAIFVPSDVSPQEIRDCLHEELAQAIGPLNDLYRLPDSVFNDDNIHAVLTGFDMLILKTYYSPQLANGMSRGEAATRLPGILASINPAGQRPGHAATNDTSRDWISAMETALASAPGLPTRRAAAENAINLVRAFGWTGTRRGFAFYAFGRLQVGHDSDLAMGAFIEADRAYRASTLTQLHSAHVSVQLAAFALSAGDATNTLRIVDGSIPTARRYQNASLLATLMMFRAEALEMLGRDDEAALIRLDSLGWARYGFGSDHNVQTRLREIRNLNPLKQR